MANPFDIAKMVRNYQKTQSMLKGIKAAGLSKDETVGILMDGTMAIVEVEIQPEAMNLTAQQMSHNFMEAYKSAKKELEKQLKASTSTDDLKDMLGM
jgi:DNA-binding protein YbaB